MELIANIIDVLPTPLAGKLKECLQVSSDTLGRRVSSMFEAWRHCMIGLTIPLYLQHGRPQAAVNAILFQSAVEENLPSAVLSGLLFQFQARQALVNTPLGLEVYELLKWAFARTGGESLVEILNLHSLYVHHGLGASSEDEFRFKQVCELLSVTARLFHRAKILGTAGGTTWEFVGENPRVASADAAPITDVWLTWDDGSELGLSAFFSIDPSTNPPQLTSIDQKGLAKRLDKALSDKHQIATYYARFRAEARGEFEFPGLHWSDSTMPLDLRDRLEEVIDFSDPGQAKLVLRHFGSEVVAEWIRRAVASRGAIGLYYPLYFSPVTLHSKAFIAWLWRQVQIALDRTVVAIPKKTEAILSQLQEFLSLLREKNKECYLLVDQVELILRDERKHAEFLNQLKSLPDMGVHVIAMGEPMRVDASGGWQTSYWTPADIPEAESRIAQMDVPAWLALIAPPGSADRRLLEFVTSADKPVRLATLCKTLGRTSPDIFVSALRMAPIFVCPRGARDLIEGFDQLQVFSPHVAASIRTGANHDDTDREALLMAEIDLDQLAAACRRYEERTIAPHHEHS
jgi:hypothetical protein